MTISTKDLKKLWGLAAGRCSKPGCGEECIRFLDSEDPTVIGEMAHIIAQQPDGPRGQPGGGEDSYENLILLCPTHHREIDKAPEGVFTAEELKRWKEEHEARISSSFLSPVFNSKKEMGQRIKRLLIQNHRVWKNSGPESQEAASNPLSSHVEIWNLRKLDTIVPNNRKVINIIKGNEHLIDLDDLDACYHFIEHAEGFERNCYERAEGVPRFPVEFERLIDTYV